MPKAKSKDKAGQGTETKPNVRPPEPPTPACKRAIRTFNRRGRELRLRARPLLVLSRSQTHELTDDFTPQPVESFNCR